MPHLIYNPIDRRTFLTRSLKAAGLAMLPYSSLADILESDAEKVHIALLSDTHIPADKEGKFREFSPYKNLQRVVSEVLKKNPESAIINGDVARIAGEPEEYKNVKALINPLAEKLPVYMTLGNHDNRDHVKQVFDLKSEVDDQQVMVVNTKPVRFLLLDTLLYVNQAAGLLGKNQRTWLAAYLKGSDDKPTILFLHHTLGDGDSDLLDVDRLFSIIKPHKKVKAIFYGHSHQYKYDSLDGIHLINQPAVGYNFSDDQPVGWLDGSFSEKGAKLTLHAFGGNLGKSGEVTELEWR